MPKFYFAEFTRKKGGEVFQKFGHTKFKDAMKRFSYNSEQYEEFDIRILASAYHHDIDKCRGAEDAFKVMYPKNLWIQEKISGVTEIVQLDTKIRNDIILKIHVLSDKWKKECFNGTDITRNAIFSNEEEAG